VKTSTFYLNFFFFSFFSFRKSFFFKHFKIGSHDVANDLVWNTRFCENKQDFHFHKHVWWRKSKWLCVFVCVFLSEWVCVCLRFCLCVSLCVRESEWDRQTDRRLLFVHWTQQLVLHTHTHTHTHTCTARKFSSSGRILYVWTCFWNLDKHTQRQIYHVDEMKLGQQLDWLFNCNHTHTHTLQIFTLGSNFHFVKSVCVCVYIIKPVHVSQTHSLLMCVHTHTHTHTYTLVNSKYYRLTHTLTIMENILYYSLKNKTTSFKYCFY